MPRINVSLKNFELNLPKLLSKTQIDQERDVIGKSYLEYNSIANCQLAHFNYFINEGLQKLISENNEIIGKYNEKLNVPYYYLRFGEIFVNKYPHTGNHDKIFPNECEHRKMHYVIPIMVDVEVYKLNLEDSALSSNTNDEIFDEDEEEHQLNGEEYINTSKIFDIDNYKHLYTNFRKRIHLYDQCVMVRSEVCSTYGLDENELIKNNEDITDRGGYFIVNGSRKVTVSQERTNFNQPSVYLNLKKPILTHYTEIKSPATVNSRSTTMQVGITKTDNIVIVLSTLPDRTMIPIGVYYKAIGLMDESEILSTILLSTDENKNNQIYEFVKPVLDKTKCVETSFNAKRFIVLKKFQKMSKETITKEEVETLFSDIIEKEFFSKFGLGNVSKKIMYLGYCIYRCLTVKLKWQKEDDRDNLSRKCLDPVSVLLLNRFYMGWTLYKNSCIKTCDKAIMRMNNFNPISKLDASMLTAHMIYCLSTGNWGNKLNTQKTGISNQFEYYNYQGTLANIRKTSASLATEGQVIKARSLHASHYGRDCPSETPEGQQCGFIKNLALYCYITIGEDYRIIAEVIKNLPDMFECIFFEKESDVTFFLSYASSARILINGDFIGYSNNPKKLTAYLIHLRRKFSINPEISIVYDDVLNDIIISTDIGRQSTPYFIVTNGQVQLTQRYIDELKTNKKTFVDLLKDGIVEFLDAKEWEYSYIVSYNEEIKENTTHVEIDPALIYGVGATKVVFPDHNQAPRNAYQAAMGRQAIGFPGYNINVRNISSKMMILNYPQKPLTYNKYDEYVLKCCELPQGQNAVVAIMPYNGYNQEDSIITSKSSIELGMGKITIYYPFHEKINIQEGFITEIPSEKCKNFTPNKYPRLDHLDEDGLVFIGERVKKGYPIIGIVHTDIDTGVKTDHSIVFKVSDEEGVVDQIQSGVDGDGYKYVKIRIVCSRDPEEGDKWASRHGQKGTNGQIVKKEDLPFNKEGITTDIIVNPLAVPSRMTVGHLLETIVGKASVTRVDEKILKKTIIKNELKEELVLKLNNKEIPSLREMIDATPFNKYWNIDYFKEALRQAGYNEYGNETLYSGITGKKIYKPIFFGITYYQRLKHMVIDKIHARSKGPQTAMYRQPTEGRSVEGGLRLGEMERDNLIAQGSSFMLKDRMLNNSDKFKVPVCQQCGIIAQSNKDTKETYCRACKNNLISDVNIPYPTKVLIQELYAMNIALRIIPET